jgi:hypothetical protein
LIKRWVEKLAVNERLARRLRVVELYRALGRATLKADDRGAKQPARDRSGTGRPLHDLGEELRQPVGFVEPVPRPVLAQRGEHRASIRLVDFAAALLEPRDAGGT